MIRSPGWGFLAAWIVAGTLAATMCGTGFVGPVSFLVLGAFQAAILYRMLGRGALEWGVATAVLGSVCSLVTIVLGAMANSGVPFPPFLTMIGLGVLTGAVLGLGQAFAMRRVSDRALIWVGLSAVAWGLAGATNGLASQIFGEQWGMNLYQQFRSTGMDEMRASRLVGIAVALLWDFPAALFSGVALRWFLMNRTTRDFSSDGIATPVDENGGAS